jgi:hypothetical protein
VEQENKEEKRKARVSPLLVEQTLASLFMVQQNSLGIQCIRVGIGYSTSGVLLWFQI